MTDARVIGKGLDKVGLGVSCGCCLLVRGRS